MKAIQRGFTLVELMITVAIVAVLASVAYPSYVQHIAKGKRASAQAVMQAIVSRQEQHMLNARSYFPAAGGDSTDIAAIKAALGVNIPTDVTGNYDLKVTSDNVGPPPAHSVQAVPKGTQATNDARCGMLTLRSTGAKTQSGTGGASCW